MTTKKLSVKEYEHMEKVAELGCIICLELGFPDSPAEIHHIRGEGEGSGMGKKASSYKVIPLCARHHRNGSESYHYSPKSFTDKWGSQKSLLLKVKNLLKYGGS